MTQPGAIAAPGSHVAHEAHHEELGFWRKYVFSTDHKVIGIQYAVTGMLFLLFGFSLMMLMRWQLAYPGAALPLMLVLGAFAIGRTSVPRAVAVTFNAPIVALCDRRVFIEEFVEVAG